MDAPTLATMTMIMAQVIILSLYGLMLAMFSYLLDFCFWRGNIFGFYLPTIGSIIARIWHPMKYESIKRIRDTEQRHDQIIDLVENNGLFKMLGGCVVCLNIWLGFITYPIIHVLTHHSYWYMIVYVLSASFFLRKIAKID